MAANVGILEPGQAIGTTPKTYVSKCVAKLMCRRLEAEPIPGMRLIRRLIIKSAQAINNIIAKPFISEPSEPCQSPRMGKLRWEPPKHKRPLKAHPWQNMNIVAPQIAWQAQ